MPKHSDQPRDESHETDPSGFREGRDYTFDEKGMMVMTRGYLLRRGYCCESGCRHCPYGFVKEENP